jgi:hypothetical protein
MKQFSKKDVYFLHEVCYISKGFFKSINLL